MTTTILGGTVYRAAEVNKPTSRDSREIELSFASDAVIERYFGREKLKIATEAIRLERILTEGPLLLHHSSNQLVGKVKRVWIDGNKVRALVRFGTSSLAEEAYQDVLNEIRTGVSFGYTVHAVEEITGPGDEVRTFLVTDWEPTEITLEPIPADITVGTTRSHPAHHSEGTRMEQTNHNARPQPADDTEAQRIHEIRAMAKIHNAAELADRYIDERRSLNEFRAALLEQISTPVTLEQEAVRARVSLGLSTRDRQGYNLMRALRYLVDPHSARLENEAGHEIEVSRAYAEQVGRSPEGLFIPHEALTRDLTAAGSGGNLVGTELLGAEFVQALRSKSIALQLGRMLTGLRGNVTIPRQIGAGAAAWVDEDEDAPGSTQTFDKIELSAKSLATYTYLSRKMLIQSTPAADMIVQTDLAEAIALGLDGAAINGSGTDPVPRGILNQSGIGAVDAGDDGTVMTWDHVVGLESQVVAANADVSSMVYLMTPEMRGHLKTTEKASGTGKFCWEDLAAVDPQGQVKAAGYLNGYAAYASNQVPSGITVGNSTDCHAVLFGDFQQLLIALWGAMDLNIDRSTHALKGGVRIVIYQDADIALRQPAAFAAMIGARAG